MVRRARWSAAPTAGPSSERGTLLALGHIEIERRATARLPRGFRVWE
ncbi:hypothetical protein [Streptomyces spiralis]|nr:hypothetical protein [Streptomyces spiralis]